MNEMIERVAKAIEDERFPHCHRMKLTPASASVRYAKAAIAAMREPTGPMLEAEADVLRGELGGLHDSAYWADGWMLAIWHSMIEAALK